ncbi:hypothetical protein BRD04_04800 [Halobacteriales archaeon QS_9_67_17]|nr:MAG: hypothetical protein BRD04_04800 [Halobacteriales archaeon QS_9_67_17]
MVTLTTRTRRERGVTLVACRLRNDAPEPRVARVASQMEPPGTAPPRHAGEDATLRVTVPGNAVVGTGFATPAEPSEPSARLIETERPTEEPGDAAVVAGLSDPRPPSTEDGSLALEARFADSEARIERLAAVAAATTVPAATRALDDEGGLAAVEALNEQVAKDRERLLAVADRALTLAGRAEAAEPPMDALERLS